MSDCRANASSSQAVARASEHWYAVHCKPRQEAVAEENLLRQGYRTYLPRICNARRRKGQWINTTEPLFPRYLFIRVDPTRHTIAPVRSTRGVSCLVRHCGVPVTIPEEIIEAIMRRAEANSGLHHDVRPLFCAGEPVRLLEGPLAGMEGVFTEECGEKRVIILLELLGKNNKIKVDRDWISQAT